MNESLRLLIRDIEKVTTEGYSPIEIGTLKVEIKQEL
jgi:hypothetical protein